MAKMITNDKARKIAYKLCEKSGKELTAIKKEFNKFLAHCYNRDTVPLEIEQLNKNEAHSNFLTHATTIDVNGNGFNKKSFVIESEFQVVNNYPGSWYARYEPGKQAAAALFKMNAEFEKAEKAYKALVDNTANALSSLRSYKRIIESFPEAVPFLEDVMKPELAIAIDLNKLRKELKNQ